MLCDRSTDPHLQCTVAEAHRHGRPADSTGACIMTPQQVHDAAGAHKTDLAKNNKAVKQGDYDSLTQKQLQAQCKNRGISIYRTKADFIKLLGQKTPGVDYSTWTSKQIMQEVKLFGISKTCTKNDLVALLKQWDVAHGAIIQEAAALPDFASMTVKELQNECLKNGISIAKTKKHFIAELEKLDPNPAKPHFMLKGKELQLKIKQFGIGKLKPKSMLIDDLQKALSIDKTAVRVVEEAAWKNLNQAMRNTAYQKNNRRIGFLSRAISAILPVTTRNRIVGNNNEIPIKLLQ